MLVSVLLHLVGSSMLLLVERSLAKCLNKLDSLVYIPPFLYTQSDCKLQLALSVGASERLKLTGIVELNRGLAAQLSFSCSPVANLVARTMAEMMMHPPISSLVDGTSLSRIKASSTP